MEMPALLSSTSGVRNNQSIRYGIPEVRRQLCSVLLLPLLLLLATGSSHAQADTPAVGPTAVVLQSRKFAAGRGIGHLHLSRQGQVVTAHLAATQAPCPSEGSQLLFVASDGYRPTDLAALSGVAAATVNVEGQPERTARDIAFTVQVGRDGQVRLVADCPRTSNVRLHYSLQLRWPTTEPMLWLADPVKLPSGSLWAHWPAFWLQRLGTTVELRLDSLALPLTQAGWRLFQLPYGFRPAEPVSWRLGEAGGTPFEVRVSPNGNVTYHSLAKEADETGLRQRAEIANDTTITWTTHDLPFIVQSGDYLHQPVGNGGTYHLMRKGNRVWAWLMANAAPVPTWMRPDLDTPIAHLSVHPYTPLPHRDWEPDLNIYSNARLRSGDRVGRMDRNPAVRYEVVGRSSSSYYDTAYFHSPIGTFNRLQTGYNWQIRYGENEVGWVSGQWIQFHGVQDEVPVTDRLFDIPGAFRPGNDPENDVQWKVKAQPVNAQGHPLTGSPVPELKLQLTSWDVGGRYEPDTATAEAGYYRYATVKSWTARSDVCYRSRAIQKAIAKAMSNDPIQVGCSDVTWQDLANLEALALESSALSNVFPYGNAWDSLDQGSVRDDDLMGLTGLRALEVTHDFNDFDGVFSLEPPPLFLSHVPQLESLTFRNIFLHQVPDDFLVHTPALQTLDLALSVNEPLPPGFLAFTPRLQSLSLNLGQELKELPPGFLARVPLLQHLNLALHGEALARLPPDLLRDAPRLETLTLHVWGDGHVPLPPGFLSHAPRLQRAVIATERARNAARRPLLVLDEPASFLTQAPRLQELWLHRVATGSDFLDHLPDTARIHWVPGNSAPMPPALSLASTKPQSRLHVRTTDPIPESSAPVTQSLDLVLSHASSEIPPATITWLSERKLRALILDLEGHLDIHPEDYQRVLEAFGAAQGRQTPSRVSLLLPSDDPQVLPRGLLSGHAYEWLHLKHLDVHTLPPAFFADVTATALLLEPGLHNTYGSDPELSLRRLLQDAQVRHLGLILPPPLWLPAGALGNLDFVCVELDLTPLLHNATFEDLQAFLNVENLSLTWQARAAKADPTARRSWWQPTVRRLQLAQPTWFETSHMPWAREQGCRRSLYLRLHGDVVVFDPHMLALMGQLRHVRLTYNPADCPQCPHIPATDR